MEGIQFHVLVSIIILQGAYGRCYEMEENPQSSNGDSIKVALKVVSKSSLKDRIHIDKIRREVTIHKSLDHDNIIKLLSFFEDKVNLYMVLELGVYGNLLSNIQASKSECTTILFNFLFLL